MSRYLIHSKAQISMNYNLSQEKKGISILKSFKRLLPFLLTQKWRLLMALVAVLISSGSGLIAPIIISRAIDRYMKVSDYHGVVTLSFLLVCVYVVLGIANYIQIRLMGRVGREVLFDLRNSIFKKVQELPVSFFNQNKAGDLISRMNNDTDKLNTFFSQGLVQMVGNFAMMSGTVVLMLLLSLKLGMATLGPAILILFITRILSPWVKRKNKKSLQTMGALSAESLESLESFKVIIAFNRADYFRNKFNEVNKNNFLAAFKAGVANAIFIPIYEFSTSSAQMVVLLYGIYLISIGQLTIGLLVGFLLYVLNFYQPLRHMAALWSITQQAMAAFERIQEILSLKSDLKIIEKDESKKCDCILEFDDVSFAYSEGNNVLQNINLKLEKGRTYALVGPTGGGKTTTASLMARLYDPSSGKVFLDGLDIRSYEAADRARKIGFIPQEPFLFSGSVRENILYGNDEYANCSDEQIVKLLHDKNLHELLNKFEKGLETKIVSNSDTISLGQKQLIAFMRAVLRQPEILILDEATANVDTVTEMLLETIISQLPEETTKVIIAHRLNTIDEADEIFFVNCGQVTNAGSFQQAVDMLLQDKRNS